MKIIALLIAYSVLIISVLLNIILPRIDVLPQTHYHLACQKYDEILLSYDNYTINCSNGLSLDPKLFKKEDYEFKVIKIN